MNTVDTEKNTLRKQVKQQRLSMPLDDIANAIIAHLDNCPVFKEAMTIACYSALTHEINLHPLMLAHPEKQWLLPKVLNDREMVFVPWHEQSDLTSGSFGVLEPSVETPHDVELGLDVDMIIVPALMIDSDGNRLGHGRGFYDRLLSTVSASTHTISPVPAAHFVSALPAEPHDKHIQAVVTELGVETFGD